VLPRWLGASGLVVGALYLLNQGDVLATAIPGFPVWDLAGLLGSTGWGLWVAALGVTILLRPVRTGSPSAATETRGANGPNGVSAINIPLEEHAHRDAPGPGRVEELRS
jgi:hypothetical protein